MPRDAPPLVRFVQELKRRRVVRVLLIYLASGFAVMEAVDILVSALSMPGWLLQAVIAGLALGLPVALVLSWVYDLTPEGVVPAEVFDASDTEAHAFRGPSRWLSPGSVVVALALVGAGAGATWLFNSMLARAVGDADPNSVAVLPFDYGGDADPSFADGLHEDLLAQLTRISGMKVISRASVLGYRERDTPIDQIARELGVATLLLGTVRRANDQVRVNVELVDPFSRESRWADTYDRTLEDVFEIQADIAARISEALEANITPAEVQALSERPTESFEAYERFVRGTEVFTRAIQTLDPAGLEASIASLDAAVGIDPQFALAHAYLSLAHEWVQRAATDPIAGAESGRRARTSARMAMRLRPQMPEASFAMAFQNSARSGGRARTEDDVRLLRTALEGLPNHAAGLRELALRLERLGRVEEAAELSFEASEREPRAVLYQIQAANHAYLLRDFARATRHLDSAFSISAGAALVSSILYRVRILLALADGSGVDGAQEVFRLEIEESNLGAQAIVARLETFPELLQGGDYDDLVSSLSPNADEEALRCRCYEVKAWTNAVAGRADRASAYWDSLAAEITTVGEWSDANAAALGRADRALVFARAERMEDARQEIEAMEALGAEVLESPAQLIGRENWRDIRYVRAEAYSALGDVHGATGILARMLAEPTGVTPELLEARIAWDSIRDDPAFSALLNR